MDDAVAPRNGDGLFKSFWLAGFESACHINRAGSRLDMIASTQHDVQVLDDYFRAADLGLLTIRDAVRWHRIEQRNDFDFSSLAPMVQAAEKSGVQVIWSLCHYGWPEDLDLFSADFPPRFARFATAVARWMADHAASAPFYTPMNEISFFAWAAGEMGYIHPFARRRGGEVKRQVVRAAIEACAAILAVDPRARFVHPEPLVHIVAPRSRPELAAAAAAYRESQFQAWDMLSGRLFPELGGSPRILDIVGVNYYHANQWELASETEYAGERLRWEDCPRDSRWMPLSRLLREVYERYRRPFLIAETSHFGAGREPWLAYITQEVRGALALGTPIDGICLYPAVDRHDWDDPSHWHHSGLWNVERDGVVLRRILHAPYAAELERSRSLLESIRLRAGI